MMKLPYDSPFNALLIVKLNILPNIEKKNLPPALINKLIRTAAFQNPEFFKAQAMRLSIFGKPRIISCAESFTKYIGLPRGCLDDLLELFSAHNIKIELSDERFSGLPIAIKFLGTLREEQTKAAEVMLSKDIGVLAATTAFGKTVVASHLIAARSVNTLVLVHRQQLLDQWCEQLSQFLDIEKKDIGIIGAGKHRPKGNIDIAMIQSLIKKGVVEDIVANYGHIVVDECHHISAISFEQVVHQCKARYITGLSATPTRKDGHHPIIFMQCGPIRYRVDARKQAEQRPFEHYVIIRETNFVIVSNGSEDTSPTIQEIYSRLITDEKRNDMIIADILNAVEEGRTPPILTERREHIDILAYKLSGKIKNVFLLKGGMGSKQRRILYEQLSGISEDEPRVLISTGKYIGEGFDDARLDTLFLTMPISWKGALAQYAGRLHRLHDKKTEVQIYDYADVSVPMLDRMLKRRLNGYNLIGYTVQK